MIFIIIILIFIQRRFKYFNCNNIVQIIKSKQKMNSKIIWKIKKNKKL